MGFILTFAGILIMCLSIILLLPFLDFPLP
jgi:hypothetical protein